MAAPWVFVVRVAATRDTENARRMIKVPAATEGEGRRLARKWARVEYPATAGWATEVTVMGSYANAPPSPADTGTR